MPYLLTENKIKAILMSRLKNQKLVEWIWNLIEKYKNQPIKVDFYKKFASNKNLKKVAPK